MNATTTLRIAFVVALASLSSAAGGSEDAAAEGRRIYRGERQTSSPARMQDVDVRFACQQCHGRNGRGGEESGIAVPPLRWRDLHRPQAGLPGFGDEADIVRAVTEGVGRDGRPLHSLMPRYTLDSGEIRSLLAYLRILDTASDPPPGVEADTLRVGSILPLSGALAETGRSIETAMHQRVQRINAAGGIYGRRIELVVIDGGSHASGLAEALRQARNDEHLLALVGSYLPGIAPETMEAVSDMPVLHSLGVPLAESRTRDSWMLPSLGEQARQLAAHMQAHCAQDGATQLLYDGSPALHDALLASGFRSEQLTVDQPTATHAHDAGNARWVALLDASRMQALRESPGRPACLGSIAVVSGVPLRAAMPPLREFIALPLPAEVRPDALWSLLGDGAIQALAEALARTGRQFDREDLRRASESLHGFSIAPGISLNYDRRRRHALDVGFAMTGGSRDGQ
ncbi:MAG: ABC transporter substrate-binding protein [Pseudoxanthomonas sp.]